MQPRRDVRHRDVHAAEFFHRAVDHLLHRRRIADIGQHGERPAPNARASSATPSIAAWLRWPLMTTFAPPRANASAMARPIFWPEPVTSAVRPANGRGEASVMAAILRLYAFTNGQPNRSIDRNAWSPGMRASCLYQSYGCFDSEGDLTSKTNVSWMNFPSLRT